MNVLKITAVLFYLLAITLVVVCFSNSTHPAAIVEITFSGACALFGAMFYGLSDAPGA
jgi:hypothetical protein